MKIVPVWANDYPLSTAAAVEMASNLLSTGIISTADEYFEVLNGMGGKYMTVTEWLSRQNISDADTLAYPNARTAYDIRNSPLGKAMA